MKAGDTETSNASFLNEGALSHKLAGQVAHLYGPQREALAFHLASTLANPSLPLLAIGSSEGFAQAVQCLVQHKLNDEAPPGQPNLLKLGMQLQLPGAGQDVALLPARLDCPSPLDSHSFESDLADMVQALVVASCVEKKFQRHATQSLHSILTSAWREKPSVNLADVIMQLNAPAKSIGALPGRIGTMRNAAKACALGLNQLLTGETGLWAKGELLNFTERFNFAPLQIFQLSYLPLEQRPRYQAVLLHRFGIWLRQQPPSSQLKGILLLGEMNSPNDASVEVTPSALLQLACEKGWGVIQPSISKRKPSPQDLSTHTFKLASGKSHTITGFNAPLQPAVDANTAVKQQTELRALLAEAETLQPNLPVRQIGPADSAWYLSGELELHYLIPRLSMRHKQHTHFRVPICAEDPNGMGNEPIESLPAPTEGVLLSNTPADCPWLAYDPNALEKAQQRILKSSCKQYPLTLYRCPKLKLVSHADETETDFTQRIKANVKEELQAALDDIERRHDRAQQRIVIRLQRAQKRLKALRQKQRKAQRRNLVRQIVGKELENELLEDLFKQRQDRVDQMQHRLDQLSERRARSKQEKREEFASQEYLVKTTQISANSKKSKIRIVELQRAI